MAKRTRAELVDAFKSGAIPTGDNFRDLIDSTFVLSDIQFYGTSGIATQPVKMFAGQAIVYNNQGDFSVDYSHVGFSNIVAALSNPIHGSPEAANNYVISSVVHSANLTSASGKAFISGDVTTGLGEHQGFAYQGSVINFFVLGI